MAVRRSPARAASFVVPIFNESAFLEKLIVPFYEWCRSEFDEFEIILAENGSSDDTVPVAEGLSARYPGLSICHGGPPDYGAALKAGSARAKQEFVFILELDCLDRAFVGNAWSRLTRGYDLVVGSKQARGSADRRPWPRRIMTWAYNFALRILFGFRGTDTHGLKAFRKSSANPQLQACRTHRSVTPTEFVLRCGRSGLRVCEIPVTIAEIRGTRASAWKLLPSVVKSLLELRRGLRGKEI